MTGTLQRYQAPFVYFIASALSLYAGVLVVGSAGTITMALLALLGVSGLVIMVGLPPSALFLGFLFAAPIFQNAAELSALGRVLGWAFYVGPALVLAVLTALRGRYARFRPADVLPAAYLVYVIAAVVLTTSLLTDNTTSTAKALFTIQAVGPVVYYFLTFGPGRDVRATAIAGTLMVAGLIQGLFAFVDAAIGWNLWGFHDWQGEDEARAVSTLSNPAVLGMFLGTSIVTAVAALTWGGPTGRLRQLSWAVLAVCTPALALTLTRGPILATALVVVLLLLLGRAWRIGLSVLAAAALALALMLPAIKQTDVYRERVTQKGTIEFRRQSQDWSLRLAAKKPVLGWGYGSFDRVKNASGFHTEGIPIQSVLKFTSHNTYLTVLVELGAVGLLLYVAPFLIVGFAAAKLARAPTPARWLIVASLGCLVVVALSASTLDLRFFSFALMLPFVYLAILRRAVEDPWSADGEAWRERPAT